MAKSDRILRVNELIKREVADILEQELFDIGALVSVTHVKTSVDLRHAKIYLSVYGSDDPSARRKVIKSLERNRSRIQQKINRDLTLKYTPVLEFLMDKNVEAADKVLSIISELEHDEEDHD